MSRIVALVVALAASAAPLAAQFTPADYFVETSVGVNQYVDSHFGNGPQGSLATMPPSPYFGGTASAFAVLTLSSSASAFATTNSKVAAGGGAGVFNKFILLPQAGFVGSTAHVAFSILLDGTLTANGSINCGSAICPTQASVDAWLTPSPAFQPDPGTPSSFAFSQIVTPPGSATVHVPYLLSGFLPVNVPLLLTASLSTSAWAGAPVSGGAADATAQFTNTLSYCASSSDPVSIVWASTQYVAPPVCERTPSTTTPEPATVGLLALGISLVGAVRWRGARRGTIR